MPAAPTSLVLSSACVAMDFLGQAPNVPILTSAAPGPITVISPPLVRTLSDRSRASVSLDISEAVLSARMLMSAPHHPITATPMPLVPTPSAHFLVAAGWVMRLQLPLKESAAPTLTSAFSRRMTATVKPLAPTPTGPLAASAILALQGLGSLVKT